MTLQSLGTAMVWPGINNPGINLLYTDGLIMDAAGEYNSFVFAAREAMTISHVGLGVANVAGSPTVDIRIETVDGATGLPSGTLWATNSNIVTGALSNGFTVHALTASASITAGQVFCVKVAFATGTSVRHTHIRGVHGYEAMGRPYRVSNTGTPAKADIAVNAGASWSLALGSSTTAFYSLWPAIQPVTAAANNTFNNTNGARRGMRFQVPFKCRCVGLNWFGSTQVGDYNAILFNDAGTELSSSSTAYEGDNSVNTAAAGTIWTYFDNPVTLSPATWYRAVLEPSSTTNVGISTITCADANYMEAMIGGGNSHYTTYASSAWDDTNTTLVPQMNILIDQLDDGVASVAIGHGNMTGGMQ